MTYHRPLHLETLESRCLLAGNVTAKVVNGELQITGDGGANYITLLEYFYDDEIGGTFRIAGKNYNGAYDAAGYPDTGTTPTTINGSTLPAVLFTSTDRIRFNLGAGNDVLYLGDNRYGGNLAGLTVNMGDGRDFMRFSKYQLYQPNSSAWIRLGGETEANIDTLRMSEIYSPTTASIAVFAGGGQDLIHAVDVEIGKNLTLDAGAGKDYVSVVSAVIGGATAFRLGSGIDTLNLENATYRTVRIDGGIGAERDVANLRLLQATDIVFDMLGGNDFVNLREDIYFSRSTTVNGGDGFDELRIGNRVAALGLQTISIEKRS
jgi:hypothetical protein